jgi:hypothetical protein
MSNFEEHRRQQDAHAAAETAASSTAAQAIALFPEMPDVLRPLAVAYARSGLTASQIAVALRDQARINEHARRRGAAPAAPNTPAATKETAASIWDAAVKHVNREHGLRQD